MIMYCIIFPVIGCILVLFLLLIQLPFTHSLSKPDAELATFHYRSSRDSDMSTKVTVAVSRHINHSKYLFVSLWDMV